MKDDKVRQAEVLKLLRSGEPLAVQGVSMGGGRPIRKKKGFWRAFRRKELWAIVSYQQKALKEAIKSMSDQFAKVMYSPYVPNEVLYISWPWIEKDKKGE